MYCHNACIDISSIFPGGGGGGGCMPLNKILDPSLAIVTLQRIRHFHNCIYICSVTYLRLVTI